MGGRAVRRGGGVNTGVRVGDGGRFSFVDSQGPDDAPVLVAIPSGPGFSGRTLGPWLDGLADAWRVATVDLPGSGRASLSPGLDYGFVSYAADLDAVRRALGAEEIVLLGHGWGAAMAVEYALAHAESVQALVLVNPLRIFTGEGQDAEAQARMVKRVEPSLIEEWMQRVAPVFSAALAGSAPWDPVEQDPWWSRMILTQFAAPPPAAWHEAMRGEAWRLRTYATYKGAAMFEPASAMARYDLAERAAALRVPTLILSCDDDANYVAPPGRHAGPLARVVESVESVIWSGVGHFPFVERRTEFAKLVATFLTRTP